MDFLNAIILGVIEGVTEFLPISSTGHLILANQWISLSGDITDTFDIIIQFGAILAVVVIYWKQLWPFVQGKLSTKVLRTWSKILVAVIPAIVLGGLFGSVVKELLFGPVVVALALIVGGIVLMFVEWRRHTEHIKSIAALSYKHAFFIGCVQCLALIPGTSRSAATIIGALFLGVARPAAAEFSFMLAIPTLAAASAYSIMKDGVVFTPHTSGLIFVGGVAAFLSAFLVIRGFMKFIQTQNFIPFAYYRVALGLVMLLIFFAG